MPRLSATLSRIKSPAVNAQPQALSRKGNDNGLDKKKLFFEHLTYDKSLIIKHKPALHQSTNLI